MDELFLAPSAPVAMPRAYWLESKMLTSAVLLVEPSATIFKEIMNTTASAPTNEFDMDILNDLFKDHAMILPHKPYILHTGEFRDEDHAKWTGNQGPAWDPVEVLSTAKYVHFSDWPLPKASSPQNTDVWKKR